jgi:hypothetical protein
VVQDPRSSFAGDEHAGAGIPRLVAEHDAGIQPTFGGPGEVDRRRSEHPDPLGVVSEPFSEPQALAVLALRIVAKCVLVDGDEGIGKCRGLANAEPLAISVGTLSKRAVYWLPMNGRSITAATTVVASQRLRDTAQRGKPCKKFTVPSMGSSIQRSPRPAGWPPSSSPRNAISGVLLCRKSRTKRSTARSTSDAGSRSPFSVSLPGARVRITSAASATARRAMARYWRCSCSLIIGR